MRKSKAKRIRIFAGPNGSGKTTIINKFPVSKIPLGVYINADDIEKAFSEKGWLSLSPYQIKFSTNSLYSFMKEKGISSKKLGDEFVYEKLKLTANRLYYQGKDLNSYIAADIAAFIRQQLLDQGISFSFETVFSHPSKIALIERAKKLGYRVYLYFVATEDPDININRVYNRVILKGHEVSPQKIKDRYYRSLDLLLDAVKLSNRAYLFDNSGKYYELIAEISNGKNVEILDIDKELPEWFIQYVYLKSR